MIDVLIRRKLVTVMQREENVCEHFTRGEDSHVKADWTETGVMLSQAKKHLDYQKLEEERKALSPEPFERAWPYRYLVFRCLSSRTVRQYISDVLKSPT